MACLCGRPFEAGGAVAVGLLLMAEAIRTADDDRWMRLNGWRYVGGCGQWEQT